MDDPQDFNSLQDQIQAALIAATRTVSQISSEDLSFQRSLSPAVGTSLDEQSSRLLALSSSLLKSATSISELETPSLQDVEDVDNNWQSVVDVVDSLLEKADSCLDEYTGVIKRKTPPTNEQRSSKWEKTQSLVNSLRTQNLVKPQLGFQNKPNNVDITPWKPLLTSKPHAIIPLDRSLGTFTDELQHQQYGYTVFLPLLLLKFAVAKPEDLTKSQRQRASKRARRLQTMGKTGSSTNGRLRYQHPYKTEILELQYPDAIYRKAEPIPYLPVESTTATFVDSFEDVLTMLAELKRTKEIAVDLEHHDARSYVGLVSLMQISTREKDWIVDTLKPWRQDLQVLNEVFADPKIVKVFHGAYMDIVWLQRDLGLYVTGLFDTYHASKVLGYPGGSLAYLLKRFVNFDADKKYQMADWRIRPLPDEMFFYARADTHYLLYIYDNLRNELVERSDPTSPEENRIELVLQRSKETSLQRFERQIYDENTGQGPGGWYQLLVKTPALLTNEQFAVFRAVHGWRDQIARKDDESTNYVMPTHAIFTLAKLIPMDMASLYGAVHPISHNVKSRTAELLALIKSAKASGKAGPSMIDVLRPDSVVAAAKADAPSSKHARPSKSGEAFFPSSVLVDQSLIRSEKSMFWGSAFGSSVWDTSSTSANNSRGLRLALPLPQLVSKVFIDSTTSLTDRSRPQNDYESPDKVHRTMSSQNRDNVEDEAFVIKNGRKRKAEAMETKQAEHEEPSGEYDISLNEEEEKVRDKAARKARWKAQKKLEKAARKLARGKSIDGSPAEAEEEEAFDYSKADSVLHKKGKEADVGGSKRKKPFDPYAKSSDAPKGMPRLQTERPGRSLTFKS